MTVWHWTFSIAAYLSAFLCIYSTRALPLSRALLQIVVFVAFVVGYWLLESFATQNGEFYYYPPDFWDMIPYFDWSQLGWLQSGTLCPWFCGASAPTTCPPIDHDGISLSIPVTEAALTFAAMSTARLLAPGKLLMWPFLTGIAMLCIDLVLDPVTSASVQCVDGDALGPGLRFWEWRVHTGLGIRWFAIPLFNFAAWYAAPIAAVAGALILGWARNFVGWWWNPASFASPDPMDLALRTITFSAFSLLFALSPAAPGAIEFKIVTMFGVLIVTLWRIYLQRLSFVYTNPRRWAYILPQLVLYAFASIALIGLLVGGAVSLSGLSIVGIPILTLGLLYCFSPYLQN